MPEEKALRHWSQFATFKCKPNSKKPATKNGFKDAQLGQDIMTFIRQGYNVAVACAMSNIIVLDLDYHDENSTAEEDLKKLEAELNSELPRTLTQSTASRNGKHLIFSANGITNPIGRIGKFIDVKYNGYIMFAPSVINGRQYQITDGIDENGNFIIAEFPNVWLDYINKDTNVNKKQTQKSDFTSLERKTYKNLDVERIFNNCAFLQHCRDNADTLSEPEWFSMISILAQIENSDELIHSLSEPYPKYSYEETQRKIDNARKFGHPQSCKHISENYPDICENCNFVKKEKEV